MSIIRINTVEKIPNRPYTINLRGYLGSHIFNADLEGVCLNIKSSHPLSEDEVQKLEDKLTEILPQSLDGTYKKKDIEKVLKDNNGIISITV